MITLKKRKSRGRMKTLFYGWKWVFTLTRSLCEEFKMIRLISAFNRIYLRAWIHVNVRPINSTNRCVQTQKFIFRAFSTSGTLGETITKKSHLNFFSETTKLSSNGISWAKIFKFLWWYINSLPYSWTSIWLQREISRHLANTLRLERENDDLAHELVTSKIELRRKLDVAEDQIETLSNSIERMTRQNEDIFEENKNLLREYEQIKEMYRRDVLRLEENGSRSEKLLAEYKNLFSEKSRRAEIEREQFELQKKHIFVCFFHNLKIIWFQFRRKCLNVANVCQNWKNGRENKASVIVQVLLILLLWYQN